MAQFYTLEEAARVLGMGPDDLKSKAQAREVRAFMDGGSWRFRVADVDELARRRGMGSDPDLSLSDVDLLGRSEGGSIPDLESHFDLSEFHMGTVDEKGQSTGSGPLLDSVTDRDILLDDLNLPPGPMANTQSTIIGLDPEGRGGKSDLIPMPRVPSDSSVRVDSDVDPLPRPATPTPGDSGRSPMNSDVRPIQRPTPPPGEGPRSPMQSDIRPVPKGGSSAPSDSDVSISPQASAQSDVRPSHPVSPGLSDSDVTLFHDADAPVTSNTPTPRPPARPAPSLGSSAELKSAESGLVPLEEEESDFELSEAGGGGAPDEGSDFELTALDASDEFDVTPQPKAPRPADSDVTGFLPSASGINLARPSDSGINLQSALGSGVNLQSGIGKDAGLSGLLGPSSSQIPLLGASSASASSVLSPNEARKAALSGTSLPTGAEKNLFDDTDFEVDAAATDHDNRTVQIDAASDFDLEEGESASEVFAIDEDDVDQNAATTLASSPSRSGSGRSGPGRSGIPSGGSAPDWDEDTSAAAVALRPRTGERKVEDETVVADEGAPAPALRLQPAGASAEWGGLWVGLLAAATVVMILLAFVSMDLAMNLRANREGSLSYGLVKQIASMFGG